MSGYCCNNLGLLYGIVMMLVAFIVIDGFYEFGKVAKFQNFLNTKREEMLKACPQNSVYNLTRQLLSARMGTLRSGSLNSRRPPLYTSRNLQHPWLPLSKRQITTNMKQIPNYSPVELSEFTRSQWFMDYIKKQPSTDNI